MTRGREPANLPTIHGHGIRQMIATQSHAPKRRRTDLIHETAGRNGVALLTGLARGIVNFFLPDTACVNIGFMGQVHEVVDHQAITASNVRQPSSERPVGVVIPFLMRDGRSVGERGVARPDSDKAVALFYRITTDRGKSLDTLAGHRNGFAIASHFQAVIAAG
jgi:hypothetical protein